MFIPESRVLLVLGGECHQSFFRRYFLIWFHPKETVPTMLFIFLSPPRFLLEIRVIIKILKNPLNKNEGKKIKMADSKN